MLVYTSCSSLMLTYHQTADDNGYSTLTIDGTFADGTTIKDGSYKVLLSALRVSGNPNLITDYEMALTPAFIVKH